MSINNAIMSINNAVIRIDGGIFKAGLVLIAICGLSTLAWLRVDLKKEGSIPF